MKGGVIKGVYAITPQTSDTDDLVARVDAALKGGVRLFQYRNKSSSYSLKRTQSAALVKCIRGYGGCLIMNDDPQLAVDVGADGVHIGVSDGSIEHARSIIGKDRILGVSCYNELARAHVAQIAGADYVAFGSFFPSATKPGAVRAGPDLLRRASVELSVPIVAIGGIESCNARQLVEAGADALAILSALFNAEDVEETASKLTKMF